MKTKKLKPGAVKKLRWICRIAAIMQAVAFLLFFALALQSDPRWGTVIQAAIVCAGGVFWIKVYEAANELLTGCIYGEEDYE